LVDFSHVLPQADVWSLGAILYESLTNRPPRPIPEGASPLNTILYSDAIPIQLVLPEIPKELMEFVQRCLAAEPSERYQNAMQMRAAMRSVAERLGIPLG
jgi:serine/threonine-protein kinase